VIVTTQPSIDEVTPKRSGDLFDLHFVPSHGGFLGFAASKEQAEILFSRCIDLVICVDIPRSMLTACYSDAVQFFDGESGKG
jgi:hypothetical protein